MRLLLMGVITMGFLSLFNCKTIYHKLTTGDHDATRKNALITLERIQSIRPGVTTPQELDDIFDGVRSSKRTYRKSFWLTWEGQRYKIDKALAYKQTIAYEPRALGGGTMLYGWKELRFVRAYFYKDVVQFYIVSHSTRDEKGKAMYGPWGNYDARELKFGSPSGLACERKRSINRLCGGIVNLPKFPPSGGNHEGDDRLAKAYQGLAIFRAQQGGVLPAESGK